MQFIGKINITLYQCVSPDITTDEVVITNERIQHIEERHPGDYEKFAGYMAEIVAEPDYIIGTNKPCTAVLLKEFEAKGEKFKLILRLKIKSDPENYKNSVISFWQIGDTTWEKTIKNKPILYKRG